MRDNEKNGFCMLFKVCTLEECPLCRASFTAEQPPSLPFCIFIIDIIYLKNSKQSSPFEMQCSNVLIRMHVHSPNYIISKMFLDGEGDVNSIDNQTVKTQGPDVILFFFRKIYPPYTFFK